MNQEKINQIEERLTKLEELIPKSTSGYSQVVGRIKQPSYTITSSNLDFGDLKSINTDPLESVKQQVTELLKQTDLPDWAEYVSVDSDGEVWYYKFKSETLIDEWCFKGDAEDYVEDVDLNGADWKQCCWKISDLLETKSDKSNIEFAPQSLLEQYKYRMKYYYESMRTALSLLEDNESDETQKQEAIKILRTYIQKSKDALKNL